LDVRQRSKEETMNDIKLDLFREELEEIVKLMNNFEAGGVTIYKTNQTELGYVLEAGVFHKANDFLGEFRVAITDESNC
jgi:hypothetical protein